MKITIAVVVAVVLIFVIVSTVHTVENNNHRSQELGVYDKCLNETSQGPDCQKIRQDCANGDSYACHLAGVLACLNEYGAGCPND